jgi:two-component system response regulator AtoC
VRSESLSSTMRICAVILADGDTLLPRHLNLSFAAPLVDENPESPWAHVDMSGTLAEVTRRVTAEVEKAKILEVLAESDGNKGRAAELLQISFKSLLAKLKEHRIE